MFIIFIRSTVLYLAVFAVIRLMGKRQVGEMQPSELIVTIMAADIATGPLQSINTPLFNGLVPLIAMILVESIMMLVILKSQRGRRWLTSKPSMLVKDGVIQQQEMKSNRITISDLYEQLRSQGYPKLDDVKHIILETNGEMSIIPKESPFPINVIADGIRLTDNIKEWKISEKWLDKQLKANGITSDKEVFLAYVDKDEGKLYIHRKEL